MNMEKTNFIFIVAGGIYPKNYRRTTVSIKANTVMDGYDAIRRWANLNFPDYNHISHRSDITEADIENPVIPPPQMKPYVSRR